MADGAHDALLDMLPVDFAEGVALVAVADRAVEVSAHLRVDIAAAMAGEALGLVQVLIVHLAEVIVANFVADGADFVARGAGAHIEAEAGHAIVADGADEILTVPTVGSDAVAAAAGVAQVADIIRGRRGIQAMAPEAGAGHVVELPQVFFVDRAGRVDRARLMAQTTRLLRRIRGDFMTDAARRLVHMLIVNLARVRPLVIVVVLVPVTDHAVHRVGHLAVAGLAFNVAGGDGLLHL